MTTAPAPAAHPLEVRGGALPRAVPVAGGLAAALAAAVLASLLAVADGGRWATAAGGNLPVDAVIAITCPAMGALVLAGRSTSRRLGWLLVGVGTAAAVTVLASAVALLAERPTTTALLAVQLQSWSWVPGFVPLATVLPLLYPDGRLPGPRWRWALVAAVAGMVLLGAGTALFPQTFAGTVPLRHPWTSEPLARVLFPVGSALLVAAVAGSVASLVVRLRRSRGLVRRQVVVLLVAACAVAASLPAAVLLPGPADTLLQSVAVGLLPVAIGVAITRHRLYDLDLAVCRALVVLSLGCCVAGAYLTLFALLDAIVPGGGASASALAAAGTGLLVHPLAVRLSRGVDRLFYGERADPYALVSTLSASFRQAVDAPQVPAQVCAALVTSLRLSSAELRRPGADRALAAAGTPHGPATDVELRHGGELVGVLTVTPRGGELVLDGRDAELVAAVADQAAPALAALRLNEDLQRSREALVTAREEERRRLRRELHDGVGAALAGVRLQLDAARTLVDGERPSRILAAAVAGVSEAVADVRRVTDDLRPPALDELGLGGSLTALADRHSTPVLVVTADVPALPPLPAATEVACFRIAAEAVANAVRHAGARKVALSVELRDTELVLAVRDDGRGLAAADAAPGTRSGLGLASMRQRAEELGGGWSLTSTPGGTTVSVVLPRRAPARRVPAR